MVPAGNEQVKATHYGKRRPGYGTEYGAVPTAEEIVNSLDNKGIGDLQFSVEELESILDERDYQDDGEVITGYISEKNKWRLEEFYD